MNKYFNKLIITIISNLKILTMFEHINISMMVTNVCVKVMTIIYSNGVILCI